MLYLRNKELQNLLKKNGFLLKSFSEDNPYLLQASKQSNFVFKITPALSSTDVEVLNNMANYGMRIKWLKEYDYKLNFYKLHSNIFKSNLELIDSRLPDILAALLLEHYFNKKNKLTDLIAHLNESNPCDFNVEINPNFYEYKIRRLLVDAALGMKAARPWTGTFNANGGYIAVKKDGEILCYHIYNWNEFQEYLVSHTKIDRPDSKPNRCDYGRVLDGLNNGYEDGSFIKLNFQIRFS